MGSRISVCVAMIKVTYTRPGEVLFARLNEYMPPVKVEIPVC